MARVTTTIVFQHEDNPLRHLILSSPEQMLINFLECQIEFTGKKMMLSFKNKFIWLCGFEKIVSDTFSSEHEVTGSEDANVYFYDLARPKNSCVNKLQVCAVLNLFANISSFYVASLRHQRDHLYF